MILNYRSAIYWTDSQQCDQATASLAHFQQALRGKSFGNTTEVSELSDFYYAEDYHQQYLAKILSYWGSRERAFAMPPNLAPSVHAGFRGMALGEFVN